VRDTFWVADRDGNLLRYDPSTFARTQILTGLDSHTCVAFRPG